MIWIALMSMIAACLMQHLGLSQAIASVVAKVARCPKCLTFWTTLFALLFAGYGIIIALVLSILMAYLSNYFGLVLIVLNRLYDKLWQRSNR